MVGGMFFYSQYIFARKGFNVYVNASLIWGELLKIVVGVYEFVASFVQDSYHRLPYILLSNYPTGNTFSIFYFTQALTRKRYQLMNLLVKQLELEGITISKFHMWYIYYARKSETKPPQKILWFCISTVRV